MIAERLTVKVKPGQMDKLIDLHNRVPKVENHPVVRLYTPKYSTHGVATIEFEFDSVADIEPYEAEWHALPETPAFMAEFMACVECVVSDEVWELH